MDSRPSDLDPYPRAQRDMGSAVLWDKSLHRSRRRRVRVRDARRNAPRQKGVTLAAGAAILASPMLPSCRPPQRAPPGPGSPGRRSPRRPWTSGATRARRRCSRTATRARPWPPCRPSCGSSTTGSSAPRPRPRSGRSSSRRGLTGTGVVDARTWEALFVPRAVLRRPRPPRPERGAENVVFVDARLARGVATTARSPRRDRATMAGDARRQATASAAPKTTGRRAPEPRGDAPGDDPAPDATRCRPPRLRPRSPHGPKPAAQRAAGGRPRQRHRDRRLRRRRGAHAHSGMDIAAPTGTAVRVANAAPSASPAPRVATARWSASGTPAA